jgi:hypothetical protein
VTVRLPVVTDPCAQASRARTEPLAGTAPVAVGWVLVEQPGPWGPTALRESGLDPALGGHLAEAVADLDVRVQLVRRPGGRWSSPGRRTVVLAHTGRTPWTEVLEIDDDAQLTSLDPTLAAAPSPPGVGTAREAPLLLVCTHGRRDRCCATFGRPIADTLAALYPEETWEVSHVGGHRFAGNLVALPQGTVYGGLEIAEAVRIAGLHADGRVDRGALRGRSAHRPPAQAAELAVLDARDDDRLDDVWVAEVRAGADGSHHCVVLAEGEVYDVEVVTEPTGEAVLLSCDADDRQDPGRRRVRSISRRRGDR